MVSGAASSQPFPLCPPGSAPPFGFVGFAGSEKGPWAGTQTRCGPSVGSRSGTWDVRDLF